MTKQKKVTKKADKMENPIESKEAKKSALLKKFEAKADNFKTKEERNNIVGYSDRKGMRLAANELIDEMKKVKKEKGTKELDDTIKRMERIGREFGRFDSMTVVNGVLNLSVTVGGAAIAAKLTEGDYAKLVIANIIGCAPVDLTASMIEKHLTGQFGDGWKKWTFRGVKIVFRTAGAAGLAAAAAHFLKGDVVEAAIVAGATQVGKMGFEKLGDIIAEW